MLATQDDGNPEQNYLGAQLERLLREYATSVTSKFPIPKELLAAATSQTAPAAPEAPSMTDDGVAVDEGDDSNSPLALWLAAIRKYDVLNEAEKALKQLRKQ
jgi:hypothetical protein